MATNSPDFLSSPEKLISALEIGEIGVWECDLRSGRKKIDAGLAAMLDYHLDEIEPTIEFWANRIHPQDKLKVERALQKYLSGNQPAYEAEYRLRTGKGEWKWILDRGKVVERDSQGTPIVIQGIHKDIQRRKLAEHDLIQERNKLEAVISALGDGLTVQDRDFRIVYQNEIQKQRQGKQLGRYCYEAYQGRKEICDGCLVARCFEDGQVHRRVTSATSSGGSELFLEVSASPLKDPEGTIIGAVETVRDITAEKLLERQLRQSQKLEAVGTLAGGIAHDFNNILGIIFGYAELSRLDVQPDSPVSENLDKIMAAANRAKDLIKQILSFSRQANVDKTFFNPQPVINEVLNMLNASLPKTIEIKKNVPSLDLSIHADPTQLHQVMMNLCVNAFQAMGEQGGVLGVEYMIADSFPLELTERESVPEHGFVRLSVTDTGYGIKPEYLDKIFDPFFTTKEQGKGTGMGLATVYGIVQEMDGTIAVQSQPGQGTTFHIYIPISEKATNDTASIDNDIPRGRERVLFVDDEKFLAEMVREMLERLGYSVTVRFSGREALNIFHEQPDNFDIVITDQTMPGMTGIELAEQLMKIKPDIPVILCTGFSNLIDAEIAITKGIKGFAYKPLTQRDISQLIRSIMDKQ